jgi:metal-responsive CopG/Arc/MetJ family transcriptional regulator
MTKMPTSAHAPKTKITVTLSPDVVRRLDALLGSPEAPSRSQLVEEALRRWLEERAQRDLETQIEEYYRALSPAEQKEDREWSTIAAEAARRLWDA